MMTNTQTNETLPNFTVMRDGELDTELNPAAPTIAEHVLDGLQAATEAVKLQTRMFAYDALHHTNYRAIRNKLVRERKEAEYIASIGLVKK